MATHSRTHENRQHRLAPFALMLLLIVAGFSVGCGSSGSSANAGGTVTTIVGNGVGAYAGDGGLANSAEMKAPSAVWMTTSGNMYVADTGNNVVRLVDLTSGYISTIAGTGNSGYAGDNGLGTQALLNAPAGVAADASGNVYISDTGNNVVRKVDATTGIITTIAGTSQASYSGNGGLATLAKLSGPQGLAIDSDGNLLIAESGNHVIRKWIAATGIIQTVAGNGAGGFNGDYFAAPSAQLDAPTDVKVDSTGNIYIADTGNHVIRMVAAGTNMITTVAGTGSSGSTGNGDTATDATLSAPEGLALDSTGNLYISDSSNNTVRVLIKSSAKIYLYAGTGTASYSGDKGSATSATFHTPIGATIDSNGNLYVADSVNNVIRRITK